MPRGLIRVGPPAGMRSSIADPPATPRSRGQRSPVRPARPFDHSRGRPFRRPARKAGRALIELGDAPDRAPARPAPPALTDRDGGRDAVNRVGIGLIETFEELSRVARKRLHVPTLAFGIQRVEGQRTLPRTADAAEDDKPIQRQVEIDPLQIMYPHATEPDAAHRIIGHRPCLNLSISSTPRLVIVAVISSLVVGPVAKSMMTSLRESQGPCWRGRRSPNGKGTSQQALCPQKAALGLPIFAFGKGIDSQAGSRDVYLLHFSDLRHPRGSVKSRRSRLFAESTPRKASDCNGLYASREMRPETPGRRPPSLR